MILLLTPIGVKIIASTADSSLKELSIEGVSGSLLTGLHIDNITWEDGDSISLKNVELKIQHYNIDKGRLIAEKVKAERLTINLTNITSEGDITSLPNFGLPLNMNAHLIQLDSLRITQDIPDEPEAKTLLFQIKNIQLKKVTINNGLLRFRRMEGTPIILDEPLKINVTEGRLNMDQPHDISTSGSVSYKHPELGNVEGKIQLAGTLTNYDFEGEVKHQQNNLGQQTIKFNGQGDYKRVHIEKMVLNSAHGTITANGRVLWDPDVRWAFKVVGNELSTKGFLADWPATVNTELRYRGTYYDNRLENIIKIVSFEGELRDVNLKVEGEIKEREGVLSTDNLDLQLGENQLKLSGRANEPFNLKWEIDANNIKQLLPNQLQNLKVAGSIKGSGILKGRVNKPEIKVNLTAKNIVYEDFKQGDESLTLKGEVTVENDLVLFKDFSIKSGVNLVHISGQASEPFNLKLDINAKNIKQLTPQLGGKIKGSGLLKGTLKKPEIEIKLSADNLAYKDFKQGKETLLVEGGVAINLESNNKAVIQLKEMIAKSGKNKVEVSGQVSEPIKLKLKINAQDLTQVSPDLAGRIKGDGKVLGSYKSLVIKTNLIASNLRYQETRLGQSELSIKGEVQLVDGVPMVKELVSQVGSNRLQITGRASSPYDLKWNIDGNNLKQLMPELSGQLFVKGRLQGSIEKPIINATVDVKKLHYKDFILGSADFVAKTKNDIYQINGNLNNLQSADQKISKTTLAVNGRIESHTILVSVDHEEAKVNLKANGGWFNPNWKGTVQQLSLGDTPVGDWKLQQPTQITLSKNSFSSSKFCLSSKRTQACSTISWSEVAGLGAKGTLQKTPLSILKPWLPGSLELHGTVSGTYNIKQNNGKPKGTIKFKLPNSNFSFKDEDGEEQIFGYKDAELTATVNDRIVNAKVRMNIVNRGKFSSDVKIKLSPENGKHTIDGSAKFDAPNINWAQSFIPHSRGLRGAFTSKASFTGLLSNPKIVGQARLKNGYLRLPEAGTELTDINLGLVSDRAGHAVLKGKMFMGKGLLSVTGNLDIKDVLKWKANINIKGNNIRFMNTNEIRATMSPDLRIGVTPQVVSIEGKVVIPQAYINLKEIPETSIDESSDAFVIGERKPGEQLSAVRIQPKVLIQLGDNVRLNAFGLRARLSGNVKITHNRRDILANGSLRVTDGKFQAYGQNLEINNGRLIFNGSPKIVGMDIRATRKVDETIVGVHLGGTLLRPKSKIFSDPTMPESEALSFLITGHSLSTSSGQESALLMSAVRGLGITGSDSLIHNIGSSFGLDDVNIVTREDFRKSELSLGKRLGPRLYVRYLVGLFDQTQKIAIEYKINKRLSLEAQSSADNFGLDFIYEIERD